MMNILKTLTILIAEDDETIAKLYQNIFSKIFNKVIITNSGNKVIEYLKTNIDDIDTIITDMNMPDGSGQDLIDYVTKQNPYPPIIVATAHTEIKEIYSKQVCILVHNKPVDIKRMLDDILFLIEKREHCRDKKSLNTLSEVSKETQKFLQILDRM